MNKDHILAEIKRTAALNGGVSLGESRFLQETGIKQSDWRGKFWARWGDAVKEAGLTPNTLQAAYKDEWLLEKYAMLVLQIKKLPVVSEFALKTRQDQDFPHYQTFSRFGSKQQLLKRVIEYCKEKQDYEDVLAIVLPHLVETIETNEDADSESESEVIGFVYMLKAGRNFKVGRSNSFDRRSRELKIQLPEQAETVHVIRTDDPTGIEAYWHKRFQEKRKNGEWFELNSADIKAFKRRKFM